MFKNQTMFKIQNKFWSEFVCDMDSCWNPDSSPSCLLWTHGRS